MAPRSATLVRLNMVSFAWYNKSPCIYPVWSRATSKNECTHLGVFVCDRACVAAVKAGRRWQST